MHIQAPRASMGGSDAQMIWPEGTNPFHTHEYLVYVERYTLVYLFALENTYTRLNAYSRYIYILYSNNVTVDVRPLCPFGCVALKNEARVIFYNIENGMHAYER